MRKDDTSSGRATDPLRLASKAVSDGVARAAALLFAVPGRPVAPTQLKLRYVYKITRSNLLRPPEAMHMEQYSC